MNSSSTLKLRVGAWSVDPGAGHMRRGDELVRLEPRMLRLLLCLVDRADQVVGTDQLLAEVWTGVVVSPDSIYQAIASLRRLLGDDPKQASYIVTVPRKGYRLVAEVGPWPEPEAAPPALPATLHVGRATAIRSTRTTIVMLVCAGLLASIAAVFWIQNRSAAIASPSTALSDAKPPQKSIAVLPFLDLTEEMKEEYFADGITEELIGRLSKLQGFKVASPTSSFYYKEKQVTVDEFARKLNVNYVLDGSVRKSGNTVRVAARLMKADKGFVIWSATYDRKVDDLLAVQDDIGEQVTKALNTAVNKF